MKQAFYTAGKQKSEIEVRISYRIIQLFSEGLYSSPNKAIEELVSNSFDAGANNVHIILSPDLAADDLPPFSVPIIMRVPVKPWHIACENTASLNLTLMAVRN